MVEWHSPEEAEAWWSEFEKLKSKVEENETRMIDLAQDVYLAVFLTFAEGENEYIGTRATYYLERVYECTNEKEMRKLMKNFLQEYQTYKKSH